MSAAITLYETVDGFNDIHGNIMELRKKLVSLHQTSDNSEQDAFNAAINKCSDILLAVDDVIAIMADELYDQFDVDMEEGL